MRIKKYGKRLKYFAVKVLNLSILILSNAQYVNEKVKS